MKYKLTGENWILRLDDNAHIPMDEKNADYQAYLKEVADGSAEVIQPTAEELLAQERERMVCSCAQGEIALHQAGVLDQVLAAVSADPVLNIAWRRAGEWRRTSATIKTLINKLGWTDEFVDDLFRAAMRIEL